MLYRKVNETLVYISIEFIIFQYKKFMYSVWNSAAVITEMKAVAQKLGLDY